MIIKCKNWQPSDEFFRGKCLYGKYNGRPSYGQCIDLCKLCKNNRDELDEYINGLPKTELSPEQVQKQKERQAHEKKLLAELPSGLKLIGNLARHLKQIHAYYKEHGVVYVEEEERQRRIGICTKCPDGKMVIKDGVMRCVLQSCGCYLDNPKDRKLLDGKTKYAALHCDNGHW